MAMNSSYLTFAGDANPYNLRQLRVCFRDWLRTLGAPRPVVDDLEMAVYEALANVAEHAYHRHDPDPVLHLQARHDQDNVLITITDHGCWRAPRHTGHHGRGLIMMREFTELNLHPTEQGTHRAHARRPAPHPTRPCLPSTAHCTVSSTGPPNDWR